MPSYHSERLGHAVHFGKQAATAPRFTSYWELRGMIKRAGVVIPQPPAHFGHGGDFAGSNWLMLGNGPDPTVRAAWTAARGGAGCCTIANAMHDEMEAAHGAKRPIPRFNGDIAIQTYSEVGAATMGAGYDPVTGDNDNGLNMQDVIQWRQQHGITDLDGNVYKLGQAVSLEPGNLDQLWEWTWLGESTDLGVVVTEAQMEQFDRHLPWDYVAGSPDLGGHAVPEIGRASLDNNGFVTWAVRHGHTRAFYERQCDEVHGSIDPLRYSAVTGLTAEGHTDQDLERYIVAVARVRAQM